MTSVPLTTPVVAVLHPGQMGAAIAAQARRTTTPLLWCSHERSQATKQRAERADLSAVSDLDALLSQVDIVLAICPPAAAEHLAETVAGHRFKGMYVEANAISPSRFQRIEHILNGAGATVVDAAIIGPPPTNDTKASLYLAGDTDSTHTLTKVFADTTVRAITLNQESPAASALKMAYASYQKATRVLAAVAHALAADYNVSEHLLTEAQRSARSPLAEPDYLSSVAARAWRWAPELLDVAQTLNDADLPPDLAVAAAHVLDHWKPQKDNWELPLTEILKQLHHDDAARDL